MPNCINCGKDVIPVKPKFSFLGCALVSLLSFLFLSVPYLLWYATRRPDVCPACGENAYKVEQTWRTGFLGGKWKLWKWKGLLRGGWGKD